MSRTPRLVDAESRVVAEPADFARALDADPVARTAHDRLSYSRKREHVLAIERAKKPETRLRFDREGPSYATGPGAVGGPYGPCQDSGRSPLTTSKESRLPWRQSTLRLGRVAAGGRTHHTSNDRG
jgi:hypothetical protein